MSDRKWVDRRRTGEVTIVSISIAYAFVSSCSPDRAEPTVDYFRTHQEERQKALALCVNDIGRLGNTAKCKNARLAAQLEDIGSSRNLPPIGLETRSREAAPPAQ